MAEDLYQVLLIDDDDDSIRTLVSLLQSENFDVSVARDLRQAAPMIDRDPPDVIILERFLVHGNAIEGCVRLRQAVPLPLMMLSRNGKESTVIEALDAGADDFLRKPVSPGEFLARVRALLRRAGSLRAAPRLLRVGLLELDARRRFAAVHGEEVKLTRTEFDILGCLMWNEGRTVGYKKLLQFVWGSTPGEGVRALRVHIAHLRRKIERDPAKPQFIRTDPGLGYRIDSRRLEEGRSGEAN